MMYYEVYNYRNAISNILCIHIYINKKNERAKRDKRETHAQRHRYTRREKDPRCIWTVKFSARGNSEYVAFCHPTQFI